MTNPFLGQINAVGFNFPPRGWIYCDGQLLAVSQNDALFSLFGTIYGGDGRTTFGVPDLRGRFIRHAGFGPGLNQVQLGQKGGSETVFMTTSQMPSHTHTLRGSNVTATVSDPSNAVLALATMGAAPDPEYSVEAADTSMSASAIVNNGGGQSFPIQNPFLAIHYCVATVGIYPSRS